MADELTLRGAPAGNIYAPLAGSLDLAAALSRLGGNLALYRELYQMFNADAGAMLSELVTLVGTGRRKEAQRVSHTLKGLGGTMGAVDLAAAAARVEAAMARAASDEDDRLLAETAGALAAACLGIEQELHTLAQAPGQRS